MSRSDTSNRVVILGAGSLGRLVENILTLRDRNVVGFLDDGVSEDRILGDIGDVSSRPVDEELVVAIGDISVRRSLYDRFVAEDREFTTAIHPSATVADSAEIGAGTIIKEQAVIEPGATIGANCIIGNGTIVCHDSTIYQHCRLAPSVTIAGEVTVGSGSYLCVDVSVDRTVSVGSNVVVASGCTIWKDISAGTTVKLPSNMDVERP